MGEGGFEKDSCFGEIYASCETSKACTYVIHSCGKAFSKGHKLQAICNKAEAVSVCTV